MYSAPSPPPRSTNVHRGSGTAAPRATTRPDSRPYGKGSRPHDPLPSDDAAPAKSAADTSRLTPRRGGAEGRLTRLLITVANGTPPVLLAPWLPTTLSPMLRRDRAGQDTSS
jgi:hypothetical protein